MHRQYLNAHAITDAVIDGQGVRSEGDLIVFPWRDGEHETDQTRQWPEPEGGLGDFKYLWARGEKGHPLHFNIARDPRCVDEGGREGGRATRPCAGEGGRRARVRGRATRPCAGEGDAPVCGTERSEHGALG